MTRETWLVLVCITAAAGALANAQQTVNKNAHQSSDGVIPKILHHIFLGTADFGPPLSKEMWAVWQENVQSCLDRSPEFKHILWNNSMILDMLHQRYPDHVQNYNSYSYGVQRADAARYFILYEYGGVYIDMDNGCQVSLRDVIAYVTDERHAAVGLQSNGWIEGVSNDVMVSAAKHRFFAQTIDSLSSYNRNYGLPYVTVMLSTGPNFLTSMFNKYQQDLEYDGDVMDVAKMPRNLTHGRNGFFSHTVGSTWHAADGHILRFILHNQQYVVVFTLLVVGLVVIRCIRMAHGFVKRRHSSGERYMKLSQSRQDIRSKLAGGLYS